MASKWKLIKKAVEMNMERLGDRVICARCKATAKTMGDVCRAVGANLDVECEGFATYDAGRAQALHDVGYFGKRTRANG